MAEYKQTDAPQFTDPALRQAVEGALGGTVHDAALATLAELRADGRDVRDLQGIQRLAGLVHLSLEDNEIDSIAGLGALRQLETLRLRGNPFVDLKSLARLSGLRELTLGGIWENEDVGTLTLEAFGPAWGLTIRSLSTLARLRELRVLVVIPHELSSIAPLAGLYKLERLTLDGFNGGGPIAKYTPLSGLTRLTELRLRSNRMPSAALDALSPLQALTALDLQDNKLDDIAALSALASLQTIDLGANQIVDLQALVDAPALGPGAQIDLRHNPLSDHAIAAQIPALEARGVRVVYTQNE